MKSVWIVGMTVVASGFALLHGADREPFAVTVYLQDQQVADPRLLMSAKSLASRMFAGIGVHLRWELGAPRPALGRQAHSDAEIVLWLSGKTPVAFHPGAAACALLSSSSSEVRVTIFYDRTLEPVVGNREASIDLLGHVLVHEIAHVLQGVTRHSEEGVMKARFTQADRRQMRSAPLPFTLLDAELIRRSLAKGKTADQRAAPE
jgi:hypothetical protein